LLAAFGWMLDREEIQEKAKLGKKNEELRESCELRTVLKSDEANL